ncbi:hypothetical protein BDC45DRAFT_542361 [Circinella umbellata]|nr:hypothetical protein BDC45DRAFT_542361 [Circinella umbellata]
MQGPLYQSYSSDSAKRSFLSIDITFYFIRHDKHVLDYVSVNVIQLRTEYNRFCRHKMVAIIIIFKIEYAQSLFDIIVIYINIYSVILYFGYHTMTPVLHDCFTLDLLGKCTNSAPLIRPR